MPQSSSSRILMILPALLLAGCGASPNATPTAALNGAGGRVLGGQQPVSGATIQMYSVGTTGDGSASTPLLTSSVTTDANGNFSLNNLYTCTPGTFVYFTATGGNPGLNGTVNNADLALMTAYGKCDTLGSSTFLSINEVTTVAAVAPLAPYMTSLSAIGSSAADVASLQNAFASATQFANTATGVSPGTGIPAGYTVPSVEINTLANILSTCINSAGGLSGDGSSCGQLFLLTTPTSGTAPTNTIAALMNLAANPTLNTAALFNLATPAAPFQPQLAQPPQTFAVQLAVPTTLQVTPATGLVFPYQTINTTSASQSITLTNTGTNSISLTTVSVVGSTASYFTAGSCPATLAGGAQCTVTIIARPTATGSFYDYLYIVSSAAGSPFAIPLSGGATSSYLLTAAPTALTYQPAPTGVPSAPEQVVLSNGSTGAVTIGSIAFTGNAALDFSQINNCPSSLSMGASCTVSVTVTPSVTTSRTAAMVITSNATNSPLTISLTENIDSLGVSLVPAIMTNYVPGVATLTNGGTATIPLQSIVASGGFTLAPTTCGSFLSAGATCTATVTPPAILSNATGSLVVTENASTPAKTVTLTSNLNPTTEMSLGSTPVGQSGSTYVLTSTSNPQGYFHGTMAGPDPLDFPVTIVCTPNAGPCTLTVTFAPTAPGLRIGVLTIPTQYGWTTTTIILYGSGT